ncbi:MAG: hypothetical protein CSA38_01870 [Flavobacteriales bacterium]|nr:MAG: hypothetical protein CSA38_01870 [Flavobacteriales bacterium]
MNLNELNEKLFAALEGVENGTIDPKKAQSIVNVSNAINSNCKLMIDAAKITKDNSVLGLVASDDKMKELSYKSTYDKKFEFALSLGYNNLSEAIGKLGKVEFENKFNKNK